VKRNEKIFISLFIITATVIFVFIGQPVKLLILAGAANGIILPLALAIMLIASHKSSLMKQYKHPAILQFFGWMVVAVMSWMGWITIQQSILKF